MFQSYDDIQQGHSDDNVNITDFLHFPKQGSEVKQNRQQSKHSVTALIWYRD